MLSDLKFAFRQLAKSPGFAFTAIATLALGIGACTTMFSIINSALLRPLPYPESGRLVELWTRLPSGDPLRAISGPAFRELREQATSFEQIALEGPVAFNLLERGHAERVQGLEVSANYLDVLRVAPQLGHAFPRHADQIGGENNVAILTDRFWRARFGADPAIVGRTLTLNQVPRTVVGVLPPDAIARDQVDFLVPLVLEDAPWRMDPDNPWAPAIARLKPDVARAEAEHEATALAAAVYTRLLPDRPWSKTVLIRPLQEVLLANTRPTLWLLFGAVALVLLIACANVASLLLVRATARQREMAVRSALGASAGRIVRQVLVESLTLALLGGAAGVVLALFVVDLAGRAIVSQLPGMMQPQIDPAALGFSLAIACGTGVAFGLFPALRAQRADLTRDLKESGRGSSAGGRTHVQSALVVAEVALTAALLAGTGLLLRSFTRVLDADLGFAPQQALVCDVTLARPDANAVEPTMALHREMLHRLSALPGVQAAGTCATLPLSGVRWGGPIGRTEHTSITQADFVGGRYFEAMGIPLLRGRYLADSDNRQDAPRVAVVSELLAAELLPGTDPIGQRVIFRKVNYEIVGVVRSIRHSQIEQKPGWFIYLPHVLNPATVRLVLRTGVSPLSLVGEVRRVIAGIDPGQSISNVRTLEQTVDRALQGRRVALVLFGLFAGSALALTCLGIYGVVAYTISQRERELGIRAALGASQRELLRLVVRDGLRPVALGVALGLLVAAGGARFIASLLYGVGAHDPAVFVVTPLLLGFVALLACWLPARRAAKVDPMIALRAE